MLILIASSTGLGYHYSIQNKRKYLIYSDFCNLCDTLVLDIEYSATPVKSLIDNSLKNLKTLSFISFENLKENMALSSTLSSAENEKISSFLYSLGKSDVNSQIKLITGFKEYSKNCENKYLDQYQKYNKLYLSFGFFGGVIISLILI